MKKITFLLSNPSGKILQTKELDLHQGENTKTISIQGISSGIYFLKISGDQINTVKKVIIEN